MRRALVFSLLVIPAIAWAVLVAWTSGVLAADSAQPWTLWTRLLVYAHFWCIRAAPFAILVLVLTAPACSAAIAWAAGTLRETEGATAAQVLLTWWFFSLGTVALGIAWVTFGTEVSLGPVTALAWAGFVSYSISLGSAYALQRQRVAAGHSSVKHLWWLALGAWLYWSTCWAALVVPIGVWILWRREVHAGAAPRQDADANSRAKPG